MNPDRQSILSFTSDVAHMEDDAFCEYCSSVLAEAFNGLHVLGYEIAETDPRVRLLDPQSRCGGTNAPPGSGTARVISVSKQNHCSAAAAINTVAHEAIHSLRSCVDSGEHHRLGFVEAAGALNRAFGLRVAKSYWRDHDPYLARDCACAFADTRDDAVFIAEHFGDSVIIDDREYILTGFRGKRAKHPDVYLTDVRDGTRIYFEASDVLSYMEWTGEKTREEKLAALCRGYMSDERVLRYKGHLYAVEGLYRRGAVFARLTLVERNAELVHSRPRQTVFVSLRSVIVRMGDAGRLWPLRQVAPTMPDHPLAKLVDQYY